MSVTSDHIKLDIWITCHSYVTSHPSRSLRYNVKPTDIITLTYHGTKNHTTVEYVQ